MPRWETHALIAPSAAQLCLKGAFSALQPRDAAAHAQHGRPFRLSFKHLAPPQANPAGRAKKMKPDSQRK